MEEVQKEFRRDPSYENAEAYHRTAWKWYLQGRLLEEELAKIMMEVQEVIQDKWEKAFNRKPH